MESFQQKVPLSLLGAFEDIFDWKVEETTGSVGSICLPLEKIVYFVTYNKRHKIQHTRAQTGVKELEK
jgi:hypothetical protein